MGGVAPAGKPPPLGGPVASVSYPSVVGKVVFHSGKGEVGCCGCNDIDDSKFPTGSSQCRAEVDPCDLLSSDVDDPKCLTPAGLCQSGVVPAGPMGHGYRAPLCAIQEVCGGGCGGWGSGHHRQNLSSIRIPQGISLEANRSSDCGGTAAWSKACTDPNGCVYDRGNWHDNNGLRFGLAPGYQLKCPKKGLLQGAPSS